MWIKTLERVDMLKVYKTLPRKKKRREPEQEPERVERRQERLINLDFVKAVDLERTGHEASVTLIYGDGKDIIVHGGDAVRAYGTIAQGFLQAATLVDLREP